MGRVAPPFVIVNLNGEDGTLEFGLQNFIRIKTTTTTKAAFAGQIFEPLKFSKPLHSQD